MMLRHCGVVWRAVLSFSLFAAALAAAAQEGAPSIVRPPEDRQFKPGGSAAFGVVAKGAEPLFYQWRKAGEPIPAETNRVLRLGNLAGADAGLYSVEVSNAQGRVVSPEARLSEGEPFNGQRDWPSLDLVPVVTNLPFSSHVTHAGDGSGRLFVSELAGRVRIIRGGALLERPFLNITNRVRRGGEQGFLSIAFPENYETSGVFYASYNRTPRGDTVISRFRVSADPDRALEDSEQVLLSNPQPGLLHNGGQIAFGPDGHLYISRGDAGGQIVGFNPAQDPGSLLGKILRIDVSGGTNGYAIPSSNPFVSQPAARGEIWAAGLRNPWRFSFDRLTGDLYIGDVGNVRREEINFQPAGSAGGQNYGWPHIEGDLPLAPGGDTNSFTAPVLAYDRNFGGSVTGGFVSRWRQDSRLWGLYIFGDYVRGAILGLDPAAGFAHRSLSHALLRPASFGEGEDGRIYAVCFISGNVSGVFEVVDSGKTVAPFLFPPTGTFTNAVEARITSATPGAWLHYSTEDRAPTALDPYILSGEIIRISRPSTLRVMAHRPDLEASEVVSATYTFQTAQPVINPSYEIADNTLVTVTSETEGAVIRYRLDDTDPDESSPVYDGPLRLSGGDSLSVRAWRDHFEPSLVSKARFVRAMTPTPQFEPAGGTVAHGTTVTLAVAAPGAVVRYELNGAEPSPESPIYTNPFAITTNVMIIARAFLEGHNPSNFAIQFYALVQSPAVVFEPAGGTVAYGTSVALVAPAPGAVIRYELNGAEPSLESPVYTAPLVVTTNVTIAARAFLERHNPGPVASHAYTLAESPAVSFEPAPGLLAKDGLVSLSVSDASAVIFYTLDGSEPTLESARYTAPLRFSESSLARARAYLAEHNPGPVAEGFYSIIFREPYVVDTWAGAPDPGFRDGPLREARFNHPQGLCFDHDGSMLVADTLNHAIRRVRDGKVTTVAGTGQPGMSNGPAASAQFNEPVSVAVGKDGNIYVADRMNGDLIRVITPEGEVTTTADIFPGDATGNIWQMEASPVFGSLLVGSASVLVMLILPAEGWYLAGNNGEWLAPVGFGVVSDNTGYATTGHKVRFVAWEVDRLFAGGVEGYADGAGNMARFSHPQDAFVLPDKSVLVSEPGRIRRITPEGRVSTLAGPYSPVSRTNELGYADGPGETARFNEAIGLIADTNGVIYVADAGNHSIRRLTRREEAPLRLEAAELSATHLTLRWQGAAGVQYQMQASQDLKTWTDTGAPVSGTGGAASSSVELSGWRFFRLKVLP